MIPQQLINRVVFLVALMLSIMSIINLLDSINCACWLHALRDLFLSVLCIDVAFRRGLMIANENK